MQSSLIGKIQKAHVYAQEPGRIDVHEFSATFRGDHDTYTHLLIGAPLALLLPARYDIAPNAPDGFVDIFDISTMTSRFGQRCQ